jgi:DNA-binding LacI/PurR family transcriptional regulator
MSERERDAIVELARRPTAHDVARRAGVSQAAVSYVLNGQRDGTARIGEATRLRILQAAAELGYVPNQAARSLRRQRTEQVAVVLNGIGLPIADVLVQSIQQSADDAGYALLVMVASTSAREVAVVEQLRRGLVDGVVFLNPRGDMTALAALARIGLAVVVISNDGTGEGIDVVRNSSPTGCAEGLGYLVARGHRRIAYIGPDNERLAIYRETLPMLGLPVDEQLIRVWPVSREHAYADTSALLALPDRPRAIFSPAQVTAVTAIWAIRDAGLRVPDDVAVLGVGNLEEGQVIRPALTTIGPVRQDFHEAAELLFSRLRGEAPPEGRVRVMEYRLIVRESA